jgi:hypothetical protein
MERVWPAAPPGGATRVPVHWPSWVVSLESVYGGTRSFDAPLADGGVQCGIAQRVSTMGKITFSAR